VLCRAIIICVLFCKIDSVAANKIAKSKNKFLDDQLLFLSQEKQNTKSSNAKAVLKFVKLNTAAQQREAVTRGRSLLPYRLRYIKTIF
jgi:hypothetical protein